jgi:hypothetical protein
MVFFSIFGGIITAAKSKRALCWSAAIRDLWAGMRKAGGKEYVYLCVQRNESRLNVMLLRSVNPSERIELA